MSYQQITIVGNLGQDATISTLDSGRHVTKLSVATSKEWKSASGEKQKMTTWWNCAWFTEKQPGVLEYLRKGGVVLVVGEVRATAYLDQRGQPAASLELIVNEIKLVSSVKSDQPAISTADTGPATQANPVLTTAPADGSDDLPF